MEKWVNKVAVVTGASSGIGKDIALKLVNHGLKVVGCGRNFDNLLKMKNEIPKEMKGEFVPIQCDVSKEEDVVRMFKFVKEKFKELSILVNSAGHAKNSPLLSGKTADWKSQFETNVLGLCMCTREAYCLIRENEHTKKNTQEVPGHIINIGSLAGHNIYPFSLLHFYAATKFSVTGITEGIRQVVYCIAFRAKELREAKSKIRVTQISPGYVDTEFVTRGFDKVVEAQVKRNIPIALQSSDISAAVIFVLSMDCHSDVNDIIIRSITELM